MDHRRHRFRRRLPLELSLVENTVFETGALNKIVRVRKRSYSDRERWDKILGPTLHRLSKTAAIDIQN